jgi:DNA-binding response OmpR family regulator
MNHKDYLLLVEDNKIVQSNNKKILSRRGYALRQAETLAETRAILAEERPLAIILDIMLPDGSGLDFLKELRARGENIPVLMLTALGTTEDQIAGLIAGSDDYMTKPYNLDVFLAKVEALLRRSAIVPEMLAAGSITLNIASQSAYVNGKDLNLTTKEFALLLFFIQNKETLISAENIYKVVWGQNLNGSKLALKTTASRLRNKLEQSEYTVVYQRGDEEGYCFEKK